MLKNVGQKLQVGSNRPMKTAEREHRAIVRSTVSVPAYSLLHSRCVKSKVPNRLIDRRLKIDRRAESMVDLTVTPLSTHACTLSSRITGVLDSINLEVR